MAHKKIRTLYGLDKLGLYRVLHYISKLNLYCIVQAKSLYYYWA